MKMAPIFTSLIIAKNASIDFVQGNELIIKDSNNNVVAGLTGGSSKEAGTTPVRIWAGGNVPGNAPFRVVRLEILSQRRRISRGQSPARVETSVVSVYLLQVWNRFPVMMPCSFLLI